MHTTNHSQSSSLTSECRKGLNRVLKGAWSGIQMGPRSVKLLVLGCIGGA